MTLVDAGPLIALIDKGQEEAHARCIAAQKSLTAPLLTTWPCLTEAMYFLGELRGWHGQRALWDFVERNALVLHAFTAEEIFRTRVLMEQYRDVPMDFADATLVAVVEERALKRIFTLDSDFYIYRIHGTDAFEVVP